MEIGTMYLKLIRLKLGRFMRRFLHRLPIMLSYIFLTFSVLTSLMILLPSCFDKVPVLSYYISELELPITYELCGEVKIIDKNGNIVNKNVEVIVGGYRTSILMSTEFNLKFTSPMTNEVFVVIRYENDGEIHEFTKCLIIEDSNHILEGEFIIYV